MSDQLIRAISRDGLIKVSAVSTRDLTSGMILANEERRGGYDDPASLSFGSAPWPSYSLFHRVKFLRQSPM